MSEAYTLISKNIDALAKCFDDIRYGEDMGEIEVDSHLRPLCEIFNAHVLEFRMPKFKKRLYWDLRQIRDCDRTLVLFNGGKASLALALEAKKRNINPYLYYVKNMDNKFARWAYPQEQAVRILAEKLELPLMVKKIKFDPKNPLYRAKIINMAIEDGVMNGCYPQIWVGTFDGVSLANAPFRFFPNTIEFKQCYEKLMRSTIKDFRLVTPLSSSSYMWDILMMNKGLARYIFSETTIDTVLTYLYSIDYNVIEEDDPGLYMKYMEKLRREYVAEVGIPPNNIEDLWKRYFFYNIYKSKHYAELIRFLE